MSDTGLEDDLGDTLTAGNPQAWKLASVLAGLVGTQVGRRGLTTVWRAVKKDDSQLNPLLKEKMRLEA